MELLIIALAVILIGLLTVEANEVGVDSRDFSDGAWHREPTGIA
jgi:hypothetical protein